MNNERDARFIEAVKFGLLADAAFKAVAGSGKSQRFVDASLELLNIANDVVRAMPSDEEPEPAALEFLDYYHFKTSRWTKEEAQGLWFVEARN